LCLEFVGMFRQTNSCVWGACWNDILKLIAFLGYYLVASEGQLPF